MSNVTIRETISLKTTPIALSTQGYFHNVLVRSLDMLCMS